MTIPTREPAAPQSREGGSGLFQILQADDASDYAEWIRRWHTWSETEVMAHPEYVRLFARSGDEVLAATYRNDAGGVLYPLILRPLGLESWAPAAQPGCDLTTPYGYGGPYAWGITGADAADFWRRLQEWARQRKVVTSFARLSVFPEQILTFDGETVPSGPNILRRLDLSDEALWDDYEPKVRQNVRRARSRGCALLVDATGEYLEDFHQVYTSTMARRHADARYFFPREFFESIVRNLRGSFTFFHVRHAGRVVSSELVLLSKHHAYFFLGGSLAEAFDVRPNDFLQHETFLWCRDAGRRRLVLGGGYKGSEGLLKYKKSFAPTGEVAFLVGTKTYDPEALQRLIAARKEWEGRRGQPWAPESGFFPAYRSGGERRQAA
jgi:hypothetical protein